jgi:phosphatidate cytidylyltransferase
MSADLRATFPGVLPRVLTALVGIPLILVADWQGGIWWEGLIAAIVIVGAHEFGWLHPGLSAVARWVTIAGALVLAASIVAVENRAVVTSLIFVGSVVLAAAVVAHLRAPVDQGVAVWPRWPTALLGALYLGLPGGVLIRWRLEEEARVQIAPYAAIVWLFVTLWVNDTTAYFVGLAAGRRRLAPRISPGKSWEGAVAGAVAATLTAAVGSVALGVPLWTGAVLGVAVSVTSQAGDFFKSSIKRRAGVKDTGTILPGHGGVIDRFDGLLAASPIVYLLIRLYGR